MAVVGSLQVFSTHFHFHKSMFIYSFSTQVGVYSLSGPIVGKLVSRFGPRAVCISGAIVARSGQESNIPMIIPFCSVVASLRPPSPPLSPWSTQAMALSQDLALEPCECSDIA